MQCRAQLVRTILTATSAGAAGPRASAVTAATKSGLRRRQVAGDCHYLLLNSLTACKPVGQCRAVLCRSPYDDDAGDGFAAGHDAHGANEAAIRAAPVQLHADVCPSAGPSRPLGCIEFRWKQCLCKATQPVTLAEAQPVLPKG